MPVRHALAVEIVVNGHQFRSKRVCSHPNAANTPIGLSFLSWKSLWNIVTVVGWHPTDLLAIGTSVRHHKVIKFCGVRQGINSSDQQRRKQKSYWYFGKGSTDRFSGVFLRLLAEIGMWWERWEMAPPPAAAAHGRTNFVSKSRRVKKINGVWRLTEFRLTESTNEGINIASWTPTNADFLD